MDTPPPARDPVAVTIVERAAALLARSSGGASMAEIARAAGVGRATLYRHFANRDELLQAMADIAVEELGDRLDDARLEAVDTREAIARVCRAFVATGGKYAALKRSGHKAGDPHRAEERIGRPLLRLLQDGAAEGAVRKDIAPELLVELFSALIETGISLVATVGVEEAAATVAALFLDGAAGQR